MKENIVQTRSLSLQYCKGCNKTNHNVRICQEIEETSKKDSNIENN